MRKAFAALMMVASVVAAQAGQFEATVGRGGRVKIPVNTAEALERSIRLLIQAKLIR